MAANQEKDAHEADDHDGKEASKGSSRTQPLITSTARNWRVLIKILEDEKAVIVILTKRQLTFETPEDQQRLQRRSGEPVPPKERRF